eukprot:5752762-Pyramimonas_sp.AAC.1
MPTRYARMFVSHERHDRASCRSARVEASADAWRPSEDSRTCGTTLAKKRATSGGKHGTLGMGH